MTILFILTSIGGALALGMCLSMIVKYLKLKFMPKKGVPETSRESYEIAKKGLIGTHHKKILKALELMDGGTADMVAQQTGMEHVAVNRRFSELVLDGKIYNTGLKMPTRKGRNAYVYKLTADTKAKSIITTDKPKKPDHKKTLSTIQQNLW